MTSKVTLFLLRSLTPAGIADFGKGSSARLFVHAYGTSLLVGLSLVWFLHVAWLPVLEKAVTELPKSGARMQKGVVAWPVEAPDILADNAFLALMTRPADPMIKDQSADVILVFSGEHLLLKSFLGKWEMPWPEAWKTELDRKTWEARLGAWQPWFLPGVCVLVILALPILWAALSVALFIPTQLLCLVVRRRAGWAPAWRVGVATWFPGAVLVVLAVLLYTFHRISVVHLAMMYTAHILVSLASWLLALFFLPPRGGAPEGGENPFGSRPKGAGKMVFK